MSKVKKNQVENPTVTTSEADKIWSEIKDKSLHMFGLPPKRVEEQCQPVSIEPSKCYLSYRGASAILAALEEALGENYAYSIVSKYIVVERKLVIK